MGEHCPHSSLLFFICFSANFAGRVFPTIAAGKSGYVAADIYQFAYVSLVLPDVPEGFSLAGRLPRKMENLRMEGCTFGHGGGSMRFPGCQYAHWNYAAAVSVSGICHINTPFFTKLQIASIIKYIICFVFLQHFFKKSLQIYNNYSTNLHDKVNF